MVKVGHNDESKENGIYMIRMNGKKAVEIGRREDNSIRLQDTSISRVHARIIVDRENERMLLQDCASKFGSMVQQEEIKLTGEAVKVKVRQYVMEVSVVQKDEK